MALPIIRIAGGILLRGGSTPDSPKVTIRRTSNNIGRRAAQLQKEFGNIKRGAHKVFKEKTPIDTGNARSKTELKGNEIQGNYPYSVRLQNGYSRQAPDGMRDDTIDWIREYLKRL